MKNFLKKMYLLYLNFYSKGKIKSFINPKTKIGKDIYIGRNCVFFKYLNSIGDYTFINDDVRIEFTKYIGKFCSISHHVLIGLGKHPIQFLSTNSIFYSKKKGYIKEDIYDTLKESGLTKIGNDVWIGAGSLIMSGITIGDGAIIAAGSVVTRDIPPYAIVGGVPAKILKYRFEKDIIDELVESKWWNVDIDILIKNYKYITNPKIFLKRIFNEI
ncbi:CatB-related O-acetyltransferase [Marinitoga sp. 1155]|uniref:CatB-related O-acetyltransferase n=1 Tax=Marinitoga sp. 1155 TaxID=1428448 RepID=UPI0006413093|nr:CatB-related O-acetyltransferase [Marinitoga sp. 1155]KLO22763.1 hypothetical protein X274_07680 [Marinitoga sp. 1155]